MKNRRLKWCCLAGILIGCLQDSRAQNDSIHEMEEIVVEGTRTSKSIADIPTRVEVLTEEIDEAATMDPSKVAHLLTHSTGIQVQTTSAAGNTANVRIQGLDGKYTQILKDGFPLYGGFSGSLSIMQIPPLDLRQIEYIKGGASTLYGGGAIAGIINLLSKDPMKKEFLMHINASQVGAFDVNSYVSNSKGKLGFSLLAQRNSHAVYDVDKDGFSDLPQLIKYNFNPRLRINFTDKTHLIFGATITDEERAGGDVTIVNGENADSSHFYLESNDVLRYTTQVKLEHMTKKEGALSFRNSISKSFRDMLNNYDINKTTALRGVQTSTFSEVSYLYKYRNYSLVFGFNYITDDFTGLQQDTGHVIIENFKTLSGFININMQIGKKVFLESGFRHDYVQDLRSFDLPRTYFLIKWTENITSRFGGGFGYRNPTVFNQESESRFYLNVLSVDPKRVKSETSRGGSIDLGLKFPIGKDFFISFNQMLFVTKLDNPLFMTDTGYHSGVYEFKNNWELQSHGAETFFKFGFYDFVFFAGYTYTVAFNNGWDGIKYLPLTPTHSLKGDLLYAIPGKWRIGADYEFKSSQDLSNGTKSPGYWTFGAVIEYTHKIYTFFANAENVTDVRQTRYESLISGPYFTPQYTEVWAPLDGFVLNGGIKLRL